MGHCLQIFELHRSIKHLGILHRKVSRVPRSLSTETRPSLCLLRITVIPCVHAWEGGLGLTANALTATFLLTTTPCATARVLWCVTAFLSSPARVEPHQYLFLAGALQMAPAGVIRLDEIGAFPSHNQANQMKMKDFVVQDTPGGCVPNVKMDFSWKAPRVFNACRFNGAG